MLSTAKAEGETKWFIGALEISLEATCIIIQKIIGKIIPQIKKTFLRSKFTEAKARSEIVNKGIISSGRVTSRMKNPIVVEKSVITIVNKFTIRIKSRRQTKAIL